MQTVCILAAGKGTRLGRQTQTFNKATLPLGPKAVISHIMEQFDIKKTQFIVALGYLSEQVRDYLALAHPQARIECVAVGNFDGPGSGPGYSLLCCKGKLQQPFFMIAVDTLFDYDLSKAPKNENWVGVADVSEEDSASYCNFALDGDGRVARIHDKERMKEVSAFIGLMYVYDYRHFWQGLEKPDMISDEHQVSSGIGALIKTSGVRAITMPWHDIGNIGGFTQAGKKFHAFDFSKVDEAIYFSGGNVIKMFADPKLVADRVAKAALKPSVFPRIEAVKSQMYLYRKVPGMTLYERNDPSIFARLLSFLDKEVWTGVAIDPAEMIQLTQKFYHDKTFGRINQFKQKIQDFVEPTQINGREVTALEPLLGSVPWEELYVGAPAFIHGDLQFDNILFDEATGRFTLIDWRQDFSGRIDAGDIYYDLAKLNGGILLNYDFVKRGDLIYRQDGHKAVVDFPSRFLSSEYKKQLTAYCAAKGYDFRKVEILTGLIFLNMAPLHTPPFDKALHALARLKLMDTLNV